MAAVKKQDEVKEVLPTHGGSYTRNHDGGLTRNEGTAYPAPSETVILPSADKLTTTKQE